MKVPEPLFVIINPLMRLLLRSPLHGLLSDSIVLITYTGRKSGKTYQTPVRYVRIDDGLRCYSTKDTQWWRNLRDGAIATMRTAGEDHRYRTEVLDDDTEAIRAALEHYLGVYPEDAVYHDVALGPDKKPIPGDLDRAAEHAVLVNATPV